MASDEHYVPYIATTMQSVMENANKEQEYIFIVLYKNLSEETLEKLKSQIAVYPYFSIKFINVSKEFEKYTLKIGHTKIWTVETYFRLIAPWLLAEFDKIIYMDGDIICNSDISVIYNTNIGVNLIAGVPDLPQISILNNPKPNKGHLSSSVIGKLNKPENYINAGFIIMNLKEFRNKFTSDDLLSLAQNAKYKYLDQDLLNSIVNDAIFILPQEFNFLNTNWDISYAPKELIGEYCKAKENPKIIHYTTTKPWKQELNPPFFHLFWKYSTRTPFIDSIIKDMTKNELIGQRAKDLFVKVLKRKLIRK